MTRKGRRGRRKLAHRDKSKEYNRYDMFLRQRFRRDTTPTVTDEFKDKVRRELVEAHVGAYEEIGWFVVVAED